MGVSEKGKGKARRQAKIAKKYSWWEHLILQIKRAKVQSDEEEKEGRKEEMEERVMGKRGGGTERKRRRKRNLDKTKKNTIVIG